MAADGDNREFGMRSVDSYSTSFAHKSIMNTAPSSQPSLRQLRLRLRLRLLLLLLILSSTKASLHPQYVIATAAADAAFSPSLSIPRSTIRTKDVYFINNNAGGFGWKTKTRRRCIDSKANEASSLSWCTSTKYSTLASKPHLSMSYSTAPLSSMVSSSSTGITTTTTTTSLRKLRRHPIFHNTNAVSKSMLVPHPNLWKRSIKTSSPPHLFSSSSQIINDVRVEFTDPIVGAHQLLVQCGIIAPAVMRDELNSRPSEEMETIDHLANVLSYFQSIVSTSSSSSSPNDNDEAEILCDNHNNHHHRQQKEKEVPCVARIVSTIGKSGTKCPRWHADHVPVRLVMSLRGPGCEYVQEESVGVGVCGGGDGKGRIGSTGGSNHRYHESEVMVNRHALNNLDEEDTTKANNVIVKTSVPTTRSSSLPSTSTSSTLIKHAKDGSCCDDGEHGNKLIAKMIHAKEGDAVLLMGKGWEEGAELNDDAINEEQLTVHDRHDGIDCCHDNAILAAVHRSPKLKPNQERILLTIDLA